MYLSRNSYPFLTRSCAAVSRCESRYNLRVAFPMGFDDISPGVCELLLEVVVYRVETFHLIDVSLGRSQFDASNRLTGGPLNLGLRVAFVLEEGKGRSHTCARSSDARDHLQADGEAHPPVSVRLWVVTTSSLRSRRGKKRNPPRVPKSTEKTPTEHTAVARYAHHL